MVIDGKVYDVTSFLMEHPGGDDILIDASGRDATREFEDVGHSGEARAQLADLQLGKLRDATPEELEKAEEEARLRGESLASGKDSDILTSIAKWLLPIALVAVAYLLRKYAK